MSTRKLCNMPVYFRIGVLFLSVFTFHVSGHGIVGNFDFLIIWFYFDLERPLSSLNFSYITHVCCCSTCIMFQFVRVESSLWESFVSTVGSIRCMGMGLLCMGCVCFVLILGSSLLPWRTPSKISLNLWNHPLWRERAVHRVTWRKAEL